jgi:predicted nucleotidyltransferase
MSTDLADLRAQRATLLETELHRIVEQLKELGAHLVVLFGSYARGRRDLLTDLDLLVVLPSEEPFVVRLRWLYAILSPRVATDIIAYTPEEFEQMRQRPFVRHALETGQVLYAHE